MGGYKQSVILNWGNGTNTGSKKGMSKVVTNDNRTGPRTEINKKRLHDAILRFGILKM